jgi:hypothetical protein
MDHESRYFFFPLHDQGGSPGMAIKKVMLRYGNPKIEIVNHGGIKFPFLEPPVGCRCSKRDRILIGKTSLPTTKG